MGKGKKRQKKKEEYVLQRDGIQNAGNTCYINSALQLIRPHLSLDKCHPASLGALLQKLFGGEISANNFIDTVDQRLGGRNLRKQDDSGVFLRDFLHLLSKEENGATESLQLRGWKTTYECEKCGAIQTDERSKDAVMFDVALPSKITSITEAIEQILRPERSNCKECAAEVIHGLTRFDVKSSLILSITDPYLNDFPLELDLRVLNENYVLTSCVAHHGISQRSGHYTAFRLENQIWREFDDLRSDIVATITGKPVLLLYTKIAENSTDVQSSLMVQDEIEQNASEANATDLHLYKRIVALLQEKDRRVREIQEQYDNEIELLQRQLSQ